MKLTQGWKWHCHPTDLPEGHVGAWPGGTVGFQVAYLLCLSPGREEEAGGPCSWGSWSRARRPPRLHLLGLGMTPRYQ